MKAFVWVMAVLFGLQSLARLDWIVTNKFPSRTLSEETFNLIFDIVLLMWAVGILS